MASCAVPGPFSSTDRRLGSLARNWSVNVTRSWVHDRMASLLTTWVSSSGPTWSIRAFVASLFASASSTNNRAESMSRCRSGPDPLNAVNASSITVCSLVSEMLGEQFVGLVEHFADVLRNGGPVQRDHVAVREVRAVGLGGAVPGNQVDVLLADRRHALDCRVDVGRNLVVAVE